MAVPDSSPCDTLQRSEEICELCTLYRYRMECCQLRFIGDRCETLLHRGPHGLGKGEPHSQGLQDGTLPGGERACGTRSLLDTPQERRFCHQLIFQLQRTLYHVYALLFRDECQQSCQQLALALPIRFLS